VATTQESLQVTGVIPSLTVDDIQKSINFYEALGFAVSHRWEENGALIGVMMRAGRTQIGLSQDDWKKGRDRQKGIGVRMILQTPHNIDDLAVRAKNAGLTLASEPQDSEFNSRAFVIRDPNGFLLTISSEMPLGA
jgi:uncharacterized glyoxalase superfamily protein PhnB